MQTRKSWSILLSILLMMSLILAACGGGTRQGNGNPGNGTATGEQPSTNGSQGAPAAAGGDKAQTRSFETKKGMVTIPAKPKRIVTDFYGGELLSVGGNVIGVEPTTFKNPFVKDLLAKANTKDIGEPLNQEKVLELAPDLIVVMKDQNYDSLSKIAPTLYLPYGTATNIYETVRLFGDIVGDKDRAEAFLAEFDKKAAAGREKLKGVVDENATFGLYELTDKGELWLFGDNAGRGGQAIYNALKLKKPDANKSDNQTIQLSMELLPKQAADYMFLTTYDPENKGEALKNLKESAVWKSLKAVKDNTVFFNDFDTYYRYDPIAITAQIDLFVEMILSRSKEAKK
ncbi:ABC transporter substrate-binding protein [Paenibacillus filicis]|uniref:ABC transporter substrate-binding protein n=1 Tax=Paenibacillus filicis TaxID=669464 RepID=A0ABU9DRQ8_9BACL